MRADVCERGRKEKYERILVGLLHYFFSIDIVWFIHNWELEV